MWREKICLLPILARCFHALASVSCTFIQLRFVLREWVCFLSFPLRFAWCKNNCRLVVMCTSLQIRSRSCAGVYQHSSVDFYNMTESGSLTGFYPRVLLEGRVLYAPLCVAVVLVGSAAPLLSGFSQSCCLVSVERSFIWFRSSKIPTVKTRSKRSYPVSSLPQLGAKENVYIDITVPAVGLDLYLWNLSVESSLLSAVYLVH